MSTTVRQTIGNDFQKMDFDSFDSFDAWGKKKVIIAMMQRSTLVLLTCLAVLTVPLDRARGASVNSDVKLAQALAADPVKVTLGPGSQGENVRFIQKRLQQLGHYRGPIDGIYGTLTQQAVKTFQAQVELSPSGILDGATWDRLNQAANINSDSASAPASDSAAAADATSPAPEDAVPAAADTLPEAGVDPAGKGGGKGWLWPILALAAVLGSFGIGFAWANRGKAGVNDKAKDEDTWGIVPQFEPDEAAAPAASSAAHPAMTNHYPPAAMGSSPASPQNGLAVGETTRLARVNIIDELIGELQTADSVTRRKAIWELGQRGNSSAVQPLVNLMVDADSKEKSLILAALSEIGIRALRPMNRALAIALQDENPEVRKNGIRDLTRIYDLVSQISQMLVHATEDEDTEVRQTANWALEQLNRIRQLPEVKSSLQSLEMTRNHAEHLMRGEVTS